jgi:hypothetical protein
MSETCPGTVIQLTAASLSELTQGSGNRPQSWSKPAKTAINCPVFSVKRGNPVNFIVPVMCQLFY